MKGKRTRSYIGCSRLLLPVQQLATWSRSVLPVLSVSWLGARGIVLAWYRKKVRRQGQGRTGQARPVQRRGGGRSCHDQCEMLRAPAALAERVRYGRLRGEPAELPVGQSTRLYRTQEGPSRLMNGYVRILPSSRSILDSVQEPRLCSRTNWGDLTLATQKPPRIPLYLCRTLEHDDRGSTALYAVCGRHDCKYGSTVFFMINMEKKRGNLQLESWSRATLASAR